MEPFYYREPTSAGRRDKTRKRYSCICKQKDGSFMKHRCDDLLKYTQFLDNQHTGWRWFNVYSNRGSDKEAQVGSFTNHRRPIHNYID